LSKSITDPVVAERIARAATTGNSALAIEIERGVAAGVIADQALERELLMLNDLMGAVTQLKLGGGHGPEYYRAGTDIADGYTSRHASEAFANWFALRYSPNGRWTATLERLLPNFDAQARRIVDGAALRHGLSNSRNCWE
jgi:hypothetical protein